MTIIQMLRPWQHDRPRVAPSAVPMTRSRPSLDVHRQNTGPDSHTTLRFLLSNRWRMPRRDKGLQLVAI
jgi:hypothetical protein